MHSPLQCHAIFNARVGTAVSIGSRRAPPHPIRPPTLAKIRVTCSPRSKNAHFNSFYVFGTRCAQYPLMPRHFQCHSGDRCLYLRWLDSSTFHYTFCPSKIRSPAVLAQKMPILPLFTTLGPCMVSSSATPFSIPHC